MDLSDFRIGAGDRFCEVKHRVTRRVKRGTWYLRGPIPGPWLERAAALSGKALHVALALWTAAGVERERQVRLSARYLRRFHIGRKGAEVGLRRLERAGLVLAIRKRGRAPVVTIREAKEPTA